LHTLNQEQSEQIAKALSAGNHVNLVSPHGRGRRQTLLEVEELLHGLIVRKTDLKRQQDEWTTWLEQTLTMEGQVIVILHNIEYIKNQELVLNRLKKFTLLCVSERPLYDESLKGALIVQL